MKFNIVIIAFSVAGISFGQHLYAQGPSALTLTDFKVSAGSEKGWEQVADAIFGIGTDKVKKAPGSGVVLYTGSNEGGAISTNASYGDTQAEFDFSVDKGATFAVLLQGRYRVNLSDSWSSTTAVTADMGGIGPLKQNGGAFTALVPLMNVAKAPGLWQHALIRFRAPKFNGTTKSTNAIFEELYINGVLVQENAEVTAPSVGSAFDNEVSTGPVTFMAGNGTVAIKNIKVETLPPVVVATGTPTRRIRRVANPILLDPSGKNYVLRSFVNFNGKKRTHVVSLGSTGQVNYSYDVKQGALFQVWHGPFMDVTEMWEQRGEPQLAKPRGSVVALTEAPALAVLVNKETTVWPDSLKFDDQKNMGYTLDKQRNPTFEYEMAGYHVTDRVAVGNADKSVLRQITVLKAPANLYARLAKGSTITAAGNGLYIVGDKGYYVQIDQKLKPWIRYSQNGSELLVPVTSNNPIVYSLIW